MSSCLLLFVAACHAALVGVATPVSVTSAPILVACSTTARTDDDIVIELRPDWAPIGVQRFLELVADGFFVDSPLFRVVKGFLVQFGVAAQPSKTRVWHAKGAIRDDDRSTMPNGKFQRGWLSFAGGGPNSRTTELFIAFRDSTHLGHAAWETPIGFVNYGMEIVDEFYSGYGDVAPFGTGPKQGELYARGNEYAKESFPKLDYIKSCHIMQEIGDTALLDEPVADVEQNLSKQTMAERKETQGGNNNALLGCLLVLSVGAAIVIWRMSGGNHSGGSTRSKKVSD